MALPRERHILLSGDWDRLGLQSCQIKNLAGVIDIDPHQVPFLIKVEDDTWHHLSRVNTDPVAEVDV